MYCSEYCFSWINCWRRSFTNRDNVMDNSFLTFPRFFKLLRGNYFESRLGNSVQGSVAVYTMTSRMLCLLRTLRTNKNRLKNELKEIIILTCVSLVWFSGSESKFSGIIRTDELTTKCLVYTVYLQRSVSCLRASVTQSHFVAFLSVGCEKHFGSLRRPVSILQIRFCQSNLSKTWFLPYFPYLKTVIIKIKWSNFSKIFGLIIHPKRKARKA